MRPARAFNISKSVIYIHLSIRRQTIKVLYNCTLLVLHIQCITAVFHTSFSFSPWPGSAYLLITAVSGPTPATLLYLDRASSPWHLGSLLYFSFCQGCSVSSFSAWISLTLEVWVLVSFLPEGSSYSSPASWAFISQRILSTPWARGLFTFLSPFQRIFFKVRTRP